MSNLKCIRLGAGEELLGEIVEQNEKIVKIKTPASVMIVPGQSSTSQFNIGLMPWMPYSDDDVFEIDRDKVVTIHNPSVELINHYNRMFGSGIQIASAGSLT